MNETEITFDRPVVIDGKEVTSLTMREPTVDDQLAAQESGGTDAQQEMRLFANLCEVSPEDIRRLPLKAYVAMREAFAGFL
ncbi:phage tail assembly protein [Roseovarius ramblicola]|uniref:Phage tail assembly protein n=1 Tax=Roseovarius ramblicola TaxID=2022336 RepID=A0ABV5I0A9_9RHOB